MPSQGRKDLRTANDIANIDERLREILQSENDVLSGGGATARQAERLQLHSRFSRAIKQDGQDIMKAKSANESTEDYVARAFLGGQYGGMANMQNSMATAAQGNKNTEKWLNRSRLERLMSMGDSQIAAYFLSSLGDTVRIYDEIDSVCAYMYQLEEAINSFRDNIVTAEEITTPISCDISFPTVTDESKLAEYMGIIKGLFNYQDFSKKFRDHLVPKMIKYGVYYLTIIPYTDIWARLRMMDNTTMVGNTKWIFESSGDDDEAKADIETIMESATTILEYANRDSRGVVPNYHGNNVPIEVKEQLDIIRENAENIIVCEDLTPPDDILGISLDKYAKKNKKMDGVTQNAIITAFEKKVNEENKRLVGLIKDDPKVTPSARGRSSDTGVVNKEIEELPGCYLKMVDPRNMVPAQVFDYTIGYYYFENFDYARVGTSLTDMLSNQMNFNQRNMIMDNIVTAVLHNLKYKDLVEGDQQLRNMILNCVLYAERRNNPIRIKFVQADYVVPFQTNTDENGRGQPVLLRSLFYGHLYTSMLLFNISAIITKSTDTEFYYLKESAIDPDYANQVSNVMDQLEDNNIDPIAIANGNILHGVRGINKRYFMNMGTGNERPIETDIISGQQIDIHNDFMTDLRKMCIGSTGCPALMVDFIDEVEYATQLGMENIKFLNRANTISRDIDPSLTEAIKKIAKYTRCSIPENDLDSMVVTLRKSKVINNSFSNNQLKDQYDMALTMVDIWNAYGENVDKNNEEIDTLRAIMAREITINQTPSVPWEMLAAIKDKAVTQAKSMIAQNKITAAQGENQQQ